MEKYLIEVPHKEDESSCIEAISIFLQTGSHFLTHADWGCRDGEHKAWLAVEVENRDQACQIIPPLYRANAKIVKLGRFTMQEINGIKEAHVEACR